MEQIHDESLRSVDRCKQLGPELLKKGKHAVREIYQIHGKSVLKARSQALDTLSKQRRRKCDQFIKRVAFSHGDACEQAMNKLHHFCQETEDGRETLIRKYKFKSRAKKDKSYYHTLKSVAIVMDRKFNGFYAEIVEASCKMIEDWENAQCHRTNDREKAFRSLSSAQSACPRALEKLSSPEINEGVSDAECPSSPSSASCDSQRFTIISEDSRKLCHVATTSPNAEPANSLLSSTIKYEDNIVRNTRETSEDGDSEISDCSVNSTPKRAKYDNDSSSSKMQLLMPSSPSIRSEITDDGSDNIVSAEPLSLSTDESLIQKTTPETVIMKYSHFCAQPSYISSLQRVASCFEISIQDGLLQLQAVWDDYPSLTLRDLYSDLLYVCPNLPVEFDASISRGCWTTNAFSEQMPFSLFVRPIGPQPRHLTKYLLNKLYLAGITICW